MCCRCSSIVLTALFLLLYTETCAGQDRFGLDSAQVKGTNNSGGGDSALWGSRNLRVVLKNILYRGGGNNFHLKPSDPQSFIRNPLPLQGIRRLHETGFGSAWYLYATNFETQYPPERLDSLRRAGFEYECHPSLTDKVVVDFMVSIREMILSPNSSAANLPAIAATCLLLRCCTCFALKAVSSVSINFQEYCLR